MASSRSSLFGRHGDQMLVLGCPGSRVCGWINGDGINGFFRLLVNGVLIGGITN